ncbi:acyl-CoA reductase [Flavobacteriaceae bacterium]|nr:acyl-CoA reductase [Flavobacteriales bacterium]MBL6877550.1 acyl-CoA reductase [Flavobacteriaceae bacterium]MDA9849372.1 acyl-CoA reductase [Flavobacteriaceae bacterium]
MNINQRIEIICGIGKFLKNYLDEKYDNNKDHKLVEFEKIIIKAQSINPWFTDENIKVNLTYWSEKLTKTNLKQWLNKYDLNNNSRKNIAIIMAGNIPLVGFHDFICVFLSGHNSIIKLSNSDNCILPFLTDLIKLPSERIVYSDSFLKDYDGVIATGSDNTSRYFDYYFKNKNSIIRKNRNSIAILDGEESDCDLKSLSNDIFTYFGLGCRNVSKLYVPRNYNFDSFFNSIFSYKELINNHKYANNYDYNKAIYLMSEYKFLDNGFFIVKEGKEMHTPISTINYEYYDNISLLREKINQQEDKIQCIVSNIEFEGKVDFGETQNPSLNQYADNMDVMNFLLTI